MITRKGGVPQREGSTENMQCMGVTPKEDTTERHMSKNGASHRMEEPTEEETPRQVGGHRKGLDQKGHATEAGISPEAQPTNTVSCTGPQKKFVHHQNGWNIAVAWGVPLKRAMVREGGG